MYNSVLSSKCVDFSTFGKLLLTIIALVKGAKCLTLNTEDVTVHLQENARIKLNCTFREENGDHIRDRDIKWQKQIGNTFVDVAIFSPPGGLEPYIHPKMKNYENRTELISPNTSLSAIMIIRDPDCDDEGVYRCLITYFSKKVDNVAESFSSVTFQATARKPNMFLISSSRLEEKSPLRLSCSADVGGPNGNIQIWILEKNANNYARIYTSNSSEIETENCTKFVNISHTYILSRGDNGAVFRCSSQNSFNHGPGPNITSTPISVTYGPDEPSVFLYPNKSSFYVGEDLTFNCTTDSNPPSNLTWTFQPKTDTIDMKNVLYSIATWFEAELVLKNVQLNSSGTYTCIARNDVGISFKNVSFDVRVPVKNSQSIKFSCDQCGSTETCKREDGEANCVTNIWIPIAIMFILLSVILIIASVAIFKQRFSFNGNQHKKSGFIHIEISPSNDKPEESNVDPIPFENLTETQNDLESLKPQDILI